MAAVEPRTGSTFSCYVLPRIPISKSAQDVTGICLSGPEQMSVAGKQVSAKPIQTAVKSLMGWLSHYSNVVLAAHNGRRFDWPVLVHTLSAIDMLDEFSSSVPALLDTLPMFKKAFPGQSSYKQESLAQCLLQAKYGAHDAVEDCKVLGKLFIHGKLSQEAIMKHSFSPGAVSNSQHFAAEKAKNIQSLQPLVGHGVMKMCTAENIAGSGLCLRHLELIHKRGGEDGLRDAFSQKNSDGQSRVTNVKKTLDEVIPRLCDYFSVSS